MNLPLAMPIPRSFRRTLRAAHLRLVYAASRTPEENLKQMTEAVRRVSASVSFPEDEAAAEEAEVIEIGVMDLPARDRDPALVQQEINGCKSLLLEIIRRAAYDWVLYRSSRRMLHKKLAEQAFTWLFVEDANHPDWAQRKAEGKQITSFLTICEALELDAESVRTHVRRLTPKNVMSVGRPAEYRRRDAFSSQQDRPRAAPRGRTAADAEWTDVGKDEDL